VDKLSAFAGRHVYLVIAAGIIILLLIADEVRRRVHSFREIEPPEAIKLINNGGVVLDLRGTDAYKAGHIIEARDVPITKLGDKLKGLKRYRNKPVILCCESRQNPSDAIKTLEAQNFEQVFPLKGGLEAWKRDNLPIAKG
jgi:rhodanese-related sulfurtransferase